MPQVLLLDLNLDLSSPNTAVWPSQRWCLFQSGVCGCEKGYTEVMTTHGFLDYCTKTPGADNKKADVKTSSGRLKPGTTQIQDFFGEWSLQPLGPGIWNADEDQADVALSYGRIAGRLYETSDRADVELGLMPRCLYPIGAMHWTES